MVASRESGSARAWVIDASNQFSAIRDSDGVWHEDIPSPMDVRNFGIIDDKAELARLFEEAWGALRGKQPHVDIQQAQRGSMR